MYITKYKTNKEIEEDNLDIFNETKRWLDIYFSGIIPNFTPRYKIEYTSLFQKEVIDIVSKIPLYMERLPKL